MQKYKVMSDFGNYTGITPVLSAISTAIPPFWSIILFVLWLFGSASSYFVILKSTGKKRFFHCLTAMSFVCFLLSLIVASMNTATITFLSGYWVGFYILAVIISWFLLSNYK